MSSELTPSPAIKVENIGKRYRIIARPGVGGVYDSIGRVLPGRRRATTEQIWALRGVSFEASPGQVLGVIGRNGSGKSTLMKILARVTAPTEGSATVHGRVGALLQVGVGFHPELSGRENIALSGAILGSTPDEIAARHDAIVAFAELERFLDTPVKHYSSGMYMRLAFSVSAHLTAEIMLVDEVLSVGDEAFRRKCERRIREVVHEGRTVLLVSHTASTVRELCDTAIVLHDGELRFVGEPSEAIDFYHHGLLNLPSRRRKRAPSHSLEQ